jgi:hypothetical protein
MAFSSSKIEAPEITGSLFGTASWAVSASWAPSNGGGTSPYQSAQASAIFDVTSGSNTAFPTTRSIGGALQPGDIHNYNQQTKFPGNVEYTASVPFIRKRFENNALPIPFGGTGYKDPIISGDYWASIVTSYDQASRTYLPMADSSMESSNLNINYYSGSAMTGSIYYAGDLKKYRIFKGIGDGGWQDLVTGGSSGLQPYQTTQSSAVFDVTTGDQGAPESRSIGGPVQPGDLYLLNQNANLPGGIPISQSNLFILKRFSSASIPTMFGGTGYPISPYDGDIWSPVMTGNDLQMRIYLPIASSSVEGVMNSFSYFSGSALTGSIYYAADIQKYRVFKGLNNGGWQDLSSGGGGGTTSTFPYTGSAIITGSLIISQIASPNTNTASLGTLAVGDSVKITGANVGGSAGIGSNITVTGTAAFAHGFQIRADGVGSHVEGQGNTAGGNYTHAEGGGNTSVAQYSHVEGSSTTTTGQYSHAEGISTIAAGIYSHAEGQNNTSVGQSSHAEGTQTTSIGVMSHAEGQNTKSIGQYTHAEGSATSAIGHQSHAEGDQTTTAGQYAHSEGRFTIAVGTHSHAEGDITTALGNYSNTKGKGTVSNAGHQLVVGMFNQISTESGSFIVGSGTSTGDRKNVLFASGAVVQITGSLLVQSGSSITGSGEVVSNAGDTFASTAKVTKMVTCTSAEYSAITTKDANTFYIIL